MENKRTFLVTGGAGFIGSAVVKLLMETTPHRVVVVDKLTYAGNPENLAAYQGDPRFRFCQNDICDREAMDRIFAEEQPDNILNLAAESHVDRSIDAPGTFVQTNVNGTYTLGRPWGKGTPIALFIDTEMAVTPKAEGWSEMSGGYPKRFAEYGSHTANGAPVDLSNRKTTYDAYDAKNGDTYINRRNETNNPVLTIEEAARHTLAAVMGQDDDWQPALLTEQAPVPTNVKLNGATLTWDDSSYTLLYAVCCDGKVVDFTQTASYVPTKDGVYTVRAANEMGGLSVPSATVDVTSGIITQKVAPASQAETIYGADGRKLTKMQRGLNIIKYGDGHTVKVVRK
jgi:hypothetical protein